MRTSLSTRFAIPLAVFLLVARPAHAALEAQSPGAVTWNAKPALVSAKSGLLSGGAVLVRDSVGRPQPNYPVTLFAADSPDSLAVGKTRASTTLRTDAFGIAKLDSTPVPTLGRNFVYVAVAGAGSITESLPVNVVSNEPQSIVPQRSLPSSWTNGVEFPPPQYLVTSGRTPIAGVRVTIAVVNGDGRLDGDQAVTDDKGLATFSHLRLTARCDQSCHKQIVVARAGTIESKPQEIELRPSDVSRLSLDMRDSVDAKVDELLIPGIRIRAVDKDDTSVEGVTILARDAAGHDVGTAKTGPSGYAAFDNVKLEGREGLTYLVFTAGSVQKVVKVVLRAGNPKSLVVVTQPPARVAFDSVWSPSPVVYVRDAAGNAVRNEEVRVRPCVRRLASSGQWQCTPGGEFLVGLQGTPTVRTDSLGRAVFSDLRLHGKTGEYQLRFELTTPFNDSTFSNSLIYNPRRDFDQNFVVISAIKTISGVAPRNEFFDLRFRFRLGDFGHILANTDVALSSRGTDSVSSTQDRLSEAAVLLNGNLHFVQDYSSDVPQRVLFGGAQLKVFNTIPYYGVHIGGTELAGSAFQGSSLSIAYLQRWFGDTLAVVNGDSIHTAKHNLGVDFFVRSSLVEFFKVLTIRGSVLMPFRSKNAGIATRIAVAVPIGDVYRF